MLDDIDRIDETAGSVQSAELLLDPMMIDIFPQLVSSRFHAKAAW
jgi:hypothetical protein